MLGTADLVPCIQELSACSPPRSEGLRGLCNIEGISLDRCGIPTASKHVFDNVFHLVCVRADMNELFHGSLKRLYQSQLLRFLGRGWIAV